jgi:hypothetical protein
MAGAVYVVVTDAEGHVLEQRYVHDDQVVGWLERNVGPAGRRCAVFEDGSASGRELLRVLWRRGQDWLQDR